MKPLETNERVLMWLYLFPPNEFARKRMKIAHVVFAMSVIMTHLISVIVGAVFIHRYMSTNLEETLFSLFHTIAAASMLYQSIGTVILRHKLTAIFEGLSKIYNESKLILGKIITNLCFYPLKIKQRLISLNSTPTQIQMKRTICSQFWWTQTTSAHGFGPFT